MGRKLNPSDAEIATVLEASKRAREDAAVQSATRLRAHKAYYCLPLGNEKEGRSRVVDTLVYNQISSLHPRLMRQFLATDLKVKIQGPDALIAAALRQTIRDEIANQGGYTLVDDVLKDGEIYHNGTAKLWWSNVWGKPDEREVVVTREELLELIDDERYSFDQSDVTPIPARRAVINDGIPTAESPGGTEMEVEGVPMYAVNVTFTDLTESGPVVVTMPPEEFIVARGKARINDRHGCGHARKIMAGELQRENDQKSKPGEPYYDKLREAADAAAGVTLTTEEQERREREDQFWGEAPPLQGEDLRRDIEVVEWCDWCSDGDELVPAFFVFGNDILLRCEENEDDIVPYSTWSPTPVPHSVIGQSSASPHVDRQNVRTVITRALLDGLARAVDRPRWVRNRGTDLIGLMNITPGKLLHGNPDDAPELDTRDLDYRMFQALEYFKAEAEEAGPSTRFNQGTDAGPGGNDTARGIEIVTRASFSKIDLVAMAFTELFLVDLYNKLITLYQKNLVLPIVVKVDGEEVTLTRKSIQGRYVARADIGGIVDFDDRAFQQASAMLNMSAGMIKQQLYPFAPSALRKMVKDVFVAGGKTEPSEYLEIAAPQAPALPPAAPGPAGMPGAPAMQPEAPAGNQTLAGGTDDPAAGMAAGE